MSWPFLGLYVASLALLPWNWLPSFPWLHPSAQWSDALFLLAAVAWVVDRWRASNWPLWRGTHLAMALYLGWAVLSHLAAGAHPRGGTFKLLGMAELMVLAVITADVASRPRGMTAIGRTFAWTGLATGLAALAGVVLHFAGSDTPLLSDLGDLEPGPYPRARAGFPLPNLLASFTIVAATAVAHREAQLPRTLRRLALAGLTVAVTLSLSRGLLGFVLTAFLWNGSGLARCRAAAAWGMASAIAILSLTYWNLALDPLQPWKAHLRSGSSSRWAAVTTSAETLAARPFWGVGPGNEPGWRFGAASDAHLTPLNVAATLGVPALLAFGAIPILLWRERERPTDVAIWAALAGLGLDALGQDVEDFRHLWVAFGIAARRKPAVAGESA